MTSESRPAPAWAGDVSLGVQAWAGETPPTSDPGSPRGRGGRAKAGQGRRRGQRPADPAASGPPADPESVARTILLNALTGQARSRKELSDKLAAKEVPEDIATRLLDRFTELGLIDDEAFAHAWVESRQRTKGLAPRALAQELRRKGIADDEAKAALEQIDDEDQRLAARALVDKKLRTLRSVDRVTATRRLAGLLARKGYSSGLAFSVVREALGERDDEDAAGDQGPDDR
jgi:regulatory protein